MGFIGLQGPAGAHRDLVVSSRSHSATRIELGNAGSIPAVSAEYLLAWGTAAVGP
jgi:hypothetical protein